MTENSVLLSFQIGTVLIAGFCVFIVLVIYFQKKKQNEFHDVQERKEQEHQVQLIERQIQVQEESMKMIAGEIHDNAVQDIVALQMLFYSLKAKVPSLKSLKLMEDIEEQIEHIKTELRNISHALHNEQIKKYGLFEMMRKELLLIKHAENIDIDIQIENTALRLPDMTEILIFRIFQESVHNIVKHADATQITMSFKSNQEQCILEIMDNGKGFDMEQVTRDGGIGINNMKTKAQVLQGEISIVSKPNQGCQLILTVPINFYERA